MQILLNYVPTLLASAVLLIGLWFANKRLVIYFEDRAHLKFRLQLIQLGGILFAILLFIIVLPFGASLRGQLLSFYGIIVSATIALSSTTLVGNILAGVMLKTIGSCRPGNFITVGDHFGRVSDMDLLHTEIQTEERDLTTLPNLYLVTNPVRVMRSSGTLLFVELSLGYDVSRHLVEEMLVGAARDTGLESPFVQIRNLGDYSVTYRVSGLLKEVKQLLDKRRELRGRTMDALHAEGIEIVSPAFMNTRALNKDQTFIAEVGEEARPTPSRSPDSIVFDKAEKAESVSRLREILGELQSRLKTSKEAVTDPASEKAAAAAQSDIEKLEERIERIKSLIDTKEAKIAEE